MKTKKVLPILAIVALLGFGLYSYLGEYKKAKVEEALVQQDREIMGQAMPKACEAEISKFCSNQVITYVTRCLRKNKSNLSDTCRSSLAP